MITFNGLCKPGSQTAYIYAMGIEIGIEKDLENLQKKDTQKWFQQFIQKSDYPMPENFLEYYRNSYGATSKRGRKGKGELGR